MLSSQGLSMRPCAGILIVTAAAVLFAGCGGPQSSFAPPSQAMTQNSAAVAQPDIIDPDQCLSHGDVHATPCRVQLTASKPVVDVSLRTPGGSKGSIVEHDTCGGATGIASISGSENDWQVTAGATKGACKARFNYFNNNKKVGWVRIKIQNQ